MERRLASWLAAFGVALSAGSACVPAQMMKNGGPKDVGTPIILLPSPDNPATCAVSFKQGVVRSHADKWLTFKVLNYCESAQTVMVGNFRTAESPSASTCAQAMYPDGTATIFQQDDARRRTAELAAAEGGDPEDDDIRLKLRSGPDLPGSGDLEYYFDVCLNGPVAQDPRLIIER